MLERLIHRQLAAFLTQHCVTDTSQHGSVSGRSTLTNVLTFDKNIVECINAVHPYNILSFDFQKAFDKAPINIL